MNYYPEGYTVALTVPFTNPAGASETPSAVTARLLDGEGAQLVDLGAQAVPGGATEIEVTIAGAQNGLAAGELRAVRILSVMITFAGGQVERRFAYALEKVTRLEVMTNSFMTYEFAEMLAEDFANMAGWSVADTRRRQVALIEAFTRLTRIPMRYAPLDPEGILLRDETVVILRDTWGDLTLDDFAGFPKHFRLALRKAQMIEANELLQGDALSRKRRAGILAEQIGESAMTLSAGVVDYGVSSETLAVLAGYVHFDMRIGRA